MDFGFSCLANCLLRSDGRDSKVLNACLCSGDIKFLAYSCYFLSLSLQLR